VTTTQPRSQEERLQAAGAALAGVHVSATAGDTSQIATEAVADFGIEEGVRMVPVRILDELSLDLRLEASDTITLASPPRVCLVGPFSAPDDAGLTDRCWGEPDLGELLAEQLGTDDAGHPTLEAGRPTIVAAVIRRGEVRCDYPPGEWQLEVTLEPLVDGRSAGALQLPPVAVSVPPTTTEPLPLMLFGTRYCGLANVVYCEQGEPPIVPAP
jgi:hypothetical protein